MSERVGATLEPGGPEVGEARSAAWDRFYSHCFRIINQCPLVRRLNSADRDDCVQEVMMEVVRKLGQRQPGENEEGLTGWIRVVSRNKAVDITRRRIRKSEVAFQDGAGAAIIAQPADSPEAMKEGDSLSLLWEALLTLDEEVTMSSYVIFYLRTIERWSIADIAQVFNLSPEHARIRCHRVKKRFGTIVKSRGGSDIASPSDGEAEKPSPKRRKRPPTSGGPS